MRLECLHYDVFVHQYTALYSCQATLNSVSSAPQKYNAFFTAVYESAHENIICVRHKHAYAIDVYNCMFIYENVHKRHILYNDHELKCVYLIQILCYHQVKFAILPKCHYEGACNCSLWENTTITQWVEEHKLVYMCVSLLLRELVTQVMLLNWLVFLLYEYKTATSTQ